MKKKYWTLLIVGVLVVALVIVLASCGNFSLKDKDLDEDEEMEDLADDLDDHAQRPDDEIQRVGPGVSEPSFQIGTHPFGCWNYERFFSPSALQA